MRRTISRFLLTAVVAAFSAQPCLAEDETFDIVRFQIEGNTLLPAAETQRAVAPMVGPKKVYGDIQKALDSLENAYRRAGYSTVQVFVPEQELTSGVVRLVVTEGVIGKVIISGNDKYFNETNIRRGLPTLREGRAPNLRQMSEEIQLSNDSPAKQLEVTLGVSEEEGKVDAKVNVTEENPQRAYLNMDGTGTKQTGRSRVGIAYQHANLFNRDHNLTLAYTGSADTPAGVKVDIFSVGYRIPFYGLGDSMDFIYGKSGVNTPSSSPTLGTALGIVGKGDVFGLRWNHHFARRGEYTSKLIYGFDYKYINSRCTTDGAPSAIDPPTPAIASCVPYTTRPVSITYSGQKLSPGQMIDYNIGVAHNIPLGSQYENSASGLTDHYSYLTSGNRTGRDDFTVMRMGMSLLKAYQSDWQVRLAMNSQYGGTALVAAEQFGLAGTTAVRGFTERAVATDNGYVFNGEVYTPDIFKGSETKESLRVLFFYDFARGTNSDVPNNSLTPVKVGIASLGTGLRYNMGKDISVRLDIGQVIDSGPANTKVRGERRGHLNMMFAF